MENKKDLSITSIPNCHFPPAWSRFFSRLIDIVIVSAIIVSLSIAVLITDKKFTWSSLQLAQPMRYFYISLLGLVVSFIFFVFFPMLFKWQTIGMKIFKLKFYFKDENKNKFLSLLKHEMFVWIIIMLISLAIGLTFGLISYQDLEILNKSIIDFKQNTTNQNSFFYYLGLVYKYLYYVFFLVFFSIIINLFIKNKQPLWHDKFSHLFVVKKNISKKSSFSTSTKKCSNDGVEHNLPGDVNTSVLEQLESVD